jgi:hypothetical protein
MKTLVLSLAALFIAVCALAASDSRSGVWTAELDGGRIHLSLFTGERGPRSNGVNQGYGNMMGLTLPIAKVEGFAPADQTKFAFRAPAGTIDFDGHFSGQQGAGHFRFTPGEAFIRDMDGLGYHNLKDDELLLFATSELSVPTMRELRTMGYEVSRHELDEIAVFRITPQTVRDFAAAGYSKLSLRQLVDLRVGNVDAAYIAAMRDLGYPHMSANDLANTAILGVTPAYVRELRSAGFTTLTAEELRNLRIGNITAGRIEAFHEIGYPNLTAHQLGEFGIQGVTPEYITAMRRAGYDNLTPHQLIEMRIFRVTPEYIKEMNSIGVTDLGKMIELRTTGAADILLRKRR